MLRQPAAPAAVDSSQAHALRGSWQSAVAIAACSAAALALSLWPFLAGAGADPLASSSVLLVVMPALLLLVLAQVMDGSMDAKTLALLGVLSAAVALIRPLGSGVGGVETVFFLLILGGRVFGATFGFALGGVSLLASALLTGGVGPWLGMQMMCSAWLAAGAGLLPRRLRGRAEIALLAAYGVIASYLFGALMNLWFWPSMAGAGAAASGIGFDPAASAGANWGRFMVFTVVTSTTSWDTVRAVTCALVLILIGRPILALLRRAGSR
ncbi:MAG: ECF transporter S component [Bifidobacteriaceae bacterium]|nr:ECF transporter S component [Bifidobacteriaceae bacterium]